MSFERVDKYHQRSTVDPRYTVAAVKSRGAWRFEAWFKERVKNRVYRSYLIAICDTADEAREMARKHKRGEIHAEPITSLIGG